MIRRTLTLFAALALLVAGFSPSADASPGGRATQTGPVINDTYVTGLEAPWDVAFIGTTAYISERDTGRVRRLNPNGTLTTVRTLAVNNAGEGGLLGLISSPDQQWLYAYITTATDNRVVRFRPAHSIFGGQVEVIYSGIPRANIHNGGRIAFGPDGMLWVATGDANNPQSSQSWLSRAGKILRMTPTGGIPSGNPLSWSRIYALGLRNPQGLAFDSQGRLYATEFGPNVDDEINIIVPGGNYGWPEVTGVAGRQGFIDPIVVRQPAQASWSGATIVRGANAWQGNLLAASLRGNRLFRFELGSNGATTTEEQLFVGQYGRLRTIVEAPDGSLWLLTNNRDGRGTPRPGDDRIIRIIPPS